MRTATGVLTNVRQLSTTADHTCAVRANDRVVCWGDGQNAKLGNGTTDQSNVAIPVPNLGGVRQVATGTDATCVLKLNGTVWCWGADFEEGLGNGPGSSPITVPVQVLRRAGQPLTGVAPISYEQRTGCALLNSGSLRCWGGRTSSSWATARRMTVAWRSW